MHDSHTHSIFSDDGQASVEEIIEKSLELGFDYVAVTDHINRDYQVLGYDNPQIDLPKYFDAMQNFKKKYAKQLNIAIGAELGFLPRANSLYVSDLRAYNFDVIINSVHCVNGSDVYFPEYFNKTPYKKHAYLEYLNAIRASLDAPYDYDIVGHIGYIQRNAPYKDPDLNYEDYPALFNDILQTIIDKNKCLEVNSKTFRGSARGSSFSLRHVSIPDVDVISRYYELGGRKISFGSDAHRANSIAYHYQKVAKAMKEIGFEGFTRYMDRKPELVKF